MLLQSVFFLYYFCLVFCLVWLTPKSLRWLPLLAASFFFVAYGHPGHLLFLVLPTLVAYAAARRLAALPPEARKARKRWLWAALILILGSLVAVKYVNFFMGTAAGVVSLFGSGWTWKPLKMILPIGISFYTFRLIGYLIDVYFKRIPAETHAGRFALFASFFPQVSAGPIERAGRFLPLLRHPETFSAERIFSGASQAAWGFFKKMVIADRLAVFVDPVFADPSGQGLNLVFAAWLYAFQIYCDFSGYTDIAIGLARMLGYESAPNFNRPYLSVGIADFWSRWHISLSTWLRDYLFLPVSYAVMRPLKQDRLFGVKVESWAYITSALLTMTLCGLWHGPTWAFVFWGALHGAFMIAGQLGRKRRRRWARKAGLTSRPALLRALRVILTFNLISFAWIFFRAPTLSKAFAYLHFLQLKINPSGWSFLVVGVLLILVLLGGERLAASDKSSGWWSRRPLPLRGAALALFVCLIILFAVDTGNEFIYIQF
ncbi:MAG TPA: MBOAT family O-acyltransferase [Candidatus Aminicenantes bacterium]|jgi:D-alanyl-lipoteichoic acid acyltransferase DltB (MBOAT superfamily)|nr:MBOAT family protein [Acidobacteriota bacterium]HNQ79656.1 MBOAT family O-acyltransferase [Candidatus Aminicenantes bacterium]MDD8030307.1 MBOAT family protein [Acidobacteriota bacterium]MDW3226549.1 MBOAT family protein [Acidobacteriota bacterium]HNT31765.1 MBOAT family O-acyltransferase [Candidatus Aminicenantes bacterium]